MISRPLTNLQMEMLQLFATDLNEDELLELKKILSDNYSYKAINEADEIYVSEGLTDDDMESWLHED